MSQVAVVCRARRRFARLAALSGDRSAFERHRGVAIGVDEQAVALEDEQAVGAYWASSISDQDEDRGLRSDGAALSHGSSGPALCWGFSAAHRRDTETESVDLAQLSKNFVLLIEQSSKAIAACLKPPGDARLDEDTAGEIIAVASTFGRVAEYWLTHPRRAIEVQANPFSLSDDAG
jgi:hypothetical protein